MSTKITNLSSATAAAGDEIPVNRSGSDYKVTAAGIAALGPNAYAGIYVYDNSTAQSIATGTVPTKLVAFAESGGANGLSANCTADKANSKITVTRAGVYYVNYSLSFANAGTGSLIWEFYVYVDGTVFPSTGGMTKMSATPGDVQCIAAGGFATIGANKDVDLRGYHSHGSSINLTVSHANLCVRFVGP